MKKAKTLLVMLGLCVLAVTNTPTVQASNPAMMEEETESDVLTVTYNDNSGISNAYSTGTLADGTVLGFYRDAFNTYFCGAISSATSISVPEKISYNGTEYTVSYCGYSSGKTSTLDFDEATSVTSLTLPASITNIKCFIPTTITDLHLQSDTPPTVYSSPKLISFSTVVWVPQSAYAAYVSLSTNSNSGWYGLEVHYEGWEPQAFTITVNTQGTLANILQSTVSQWTDVDELTVIGHLNTDDLKVLTRLKQMRKLDLSQTDITVMTGCSGLIMLQEVLLPSTVVEVDGNAFYGCGKLKEISITNATTIGSSAFQDCSSLTTVSLPAAISIGSYAFDDCSSLTSVSLPATTSIGNYAFHECNSLTTVNLPSATSIDYWAFYGCSSLTTVSLPVATSIGSSAFSGCSSLTSVSLPAAISIGDYAFKSCSSLTEVSLSAAISIGDYAFENLSSLTEVSLPAATSIGRCAFSQCSSLTEVSLPAATSFGYSAFSGCSSLTSVSLSACLQSLNNTTFYNCSQLKDVYCYAIVPFATTAFSSVCSAATLHVPAFSRTAYMLHDSWCSFYQIVSLEGIIDQLTVNDNFTIVDYTGLADKIDLSLTQNGHLTVSGGSALNLGTFTQTQATTTSSRYDSSIGGYVYTGISTLIPNNEIKADDVTLSLSVQTKRWNFISLPFDVNVADIEYPEGTLWVIRKYSGADRAALTGNTWQNMTDSMTLQAGEGYILHCANESTSNVEFVFHAVDNDRKNGIFAYQDVVKPLATYASEYAHNRSWNLVGNPYPAYFDTHNIEHNGVITVYGNNSSSSSTNYGYTAYSLLDDDYVLRPNESFFVQCPTDATSMTFKAEGRMHSNSTNSSNARTLRAQANANRQVYNLTLSNEDFTDRTRLVINPDAKMDYEINCDASKFMSDDASVPQLYVYDNGIRYAIDERPLGNGIVGLGTRFGQTGEYTIALTRNPAENMMVMLTDNETGREVNLAEETYTFTAQAGTSESRFTLTIGGELTGIEQISNLKSQTSNLYDLQGRRTNAQSQKGIYIIKQNGKNRKVVK
jgi:hypothetical protein